MYRNMSEKMGDHIPRTTSEARLCLKCQNQFSSEHKFNRICKACKEHYAKTGSGHPTEYDRVYR